MKNKLADCFVKDLFEVEQFSLFSERSKNYFKAKTIQIHINA